MDKRLAIIRSLLLLSIFFSWSEIHGQVRNKYDLHAKYQITDIISSLDQSYTDEIYGYERPAILGNLNNSHGSEFGILYSDFSYFIQPGLIYTYMSYTGNSSLQSEFDDLHLISHALGIQCKVNLLAYGKQRITPYFQANASYMFSKITSSYNEFSVATGSGIQDILYNLDLSSESPAETFVNPVFDISLGTEIILADRLYFIAELGLRMKNYPDMDMPSPILINELLFSTGIRYKILKDKRYNLR